MKGIEQIPSFQKYAYSTRADKHSHFKKRTMMKPEHYRPAPTIHRNAFPSRGTKRTNMQK